MIRFLKRLLNAGREWRHRSHISAVTRLLSSQAPPDTSCSEREFDSLQARYPKRPEYGYDLSSLFERAATRAADIHRRAGAGDARLKILELGAGDGMLGVLLAAAGHDVTLCDLDDWRIPVAKSLSFLKADCCVALPFDSGQFDLICSYNSFEHFSDPRRAFEESARVTKSNGIMHFEFGPLYCSQWGLHAYRSLLMPYPQFLFSEEFIHGKLLELGIWDLGTERTELQTLNKWKPSQFAALWESRGCKIIDYHEFQDASCLDVVKEYSASFRGRGLTYNDITCSAISVTLRKT